MEHIKNKLQTKIYELLLKYKVREVRLKYGQIEGDPIVVYDEVFGDYQYGDKNELLYVIEGLEFALRCLENE